MTFKITLRKLVKLLAKPLVGLLVQEVNKEVLPILHNLVDFYNSSDDDKQSKYDHTKDPIGNLHLFEDLKVRLIKANIPIEDIDIDILDFENWLKSFPGIEKFYRGMGDVFIEKCLEHYLAYRYLRINKDEVYIDIAASGSPFADILKNMGIRSYNLDLVYPKGLHGNKIGADAGDTKLPEKFVSVLSMQCAYECFMGDADIRFVREASRILNQRGRYAILPLYLDDVYYVATSPFCHQEEILIDDGAKKVWRDDGYKVPFSRHYSPEAFSKRIYSVIPDDMVGKVLYVKNMEDVIKHYRDQRIYCFFMFYCEKKLTEVTLAKQRSLTE